MSSTEKIKRRCVFCGSEGVTSEHVWPEWIGKLVRDYLGGGGGQWTTLHPGGGMFRQKDLDITVKQVCHACNSRWMSQLEDEAIPVLTPLIAPKRAPIDLAHASQVTLARWAFKTALMADFLTVGPRLFAPSVYSDFFLNRLPPDRCFIWIAGHVAVAPRPRIMLLPQHGEFGLRWRLSGLPFDRKVDVAVVTICILTVVFQVLIHDGDVFPSGAFGHVEGIRLIWPANDATILWPPDMKLLSERALFAFASRYHRPMDGPIRAT